MSENVENIVINVDFRRGDLSSIFANEVQVVPGDIDWEDLELMLKVYADHDCIKVSYADDDNDMVLVESKEELEEAFKVARKCNNTLKLTVICEGQPCPPDLIDCDREPVISPDSDSQFIDLFPGEQPFLQRMSPGDQWPIGRGLMINEDDANPPYQKNRGSEDKDSAISNQCQQLPAIEHKSFFIINARCRHLVLDVEGCGTHPGARVIVWYKKNPCEGIQNQLWYKDNQTATIRTRLNDFCLDVVDSKLVVNPCDLNKTSQKWTIEGNRIQNVFSVSWVIGLKKTDPSACEEVFGLADDTLLNLQWVLEAPECNELNGKTASVNSFSLGNLCYKIPSCSGRQPAVVYFCDMCDQIITGIRFKCGFCPDFDLCASCEAKEGVHDATHLLLKMRVPQDQIQLKLSTLEPLLKNRMLGDGSEAMGGMTSFCKKAHKKVHRIVCKLPRLEEKSHWKEKCQKKILEYFGRNLSPDARDLEATLLFDKENLAAVEIQSDFKMEKQWMLENTGTSAWTSDIRVECIERDFNAEVDYCVSTVPVSFGGLLPAGVITITVTATAPRPKDTARQCHSSWRLRKGKEFFGPLLEFDFTILLEVDAETSEEQEKGVSCCEIDGARIASKDEDDDNDEEEEEEEALFQDARSRKLSFVEDLLNAELNREADVTCLPLTVPSNTPLGDTPPYTPRVMELPEPELASSQSCCATEGVVSTSEDDPDFVNMAVMADLVHKKMSDLVTDGDYEYVDVDGMSSSSSSSTSSDSTDEFYVVPIPDCFNPELPPRKEASTTVVVKKYGSRTSCSLKSIDEMLSTSNCLAAVPLLSPRSCFSVASVVGDVSCDQMELENPEQDEALFDEAESSVSQQDVGASGAQNPRKHGSVTLDGAAEPAPEQQQVTEAEHAEADAAAESERILDINQNETSPVPLQVNEAQEGTEAAPQEQPEQADTRPKHSDTEAMEGASALASGGGGGGGGVEASTLKLASSLFSFVAKAAKDIFYTIQDKNLYIPQRSDWTPSQDQWMPNAPTWIPQQQPAWCPSAIPQWNPPADPNTMPYPTSTRHLSPMDQLIDMGFADRGLNRELLESCDNNVEAVVQKLVEMNGNIR